MTGPIVMGLAGVTLIGSTGIGVVTGVRRMGDTFAYHGRDGGEIRRLTATYLVTEGAAGRRISVLAVHSP